MALLRRTLGLTIARHTRHRTAESTAHTIRHTLAKITQLTLRLLLLALGILLLARLLEILAADEIPERLFAAAESLVPVAGLTIRVVGSHAGGRDGDTTDVAAGFGEVVFGCCFCLLVFGGLLVGWVAGEAAEGRLNYAAGLGRVLVVLLRDAEGSEYEELTLSMYD